MSQINVTIKGIAPLLQHRFPEEKEDSKSTKVRARPLDAVLDELGIKAVDWIKIDVEGAEVEVLRGLGKTISRSPLLKLLVEVHSDKLKQSCLPILRERRREVRQINGDHLFASHITYSDDSTNVRQAS